MLRNTVLLPLLPHPIQFHTIAEAFVNHHRDGECCRNEHQACHPTALHLSLITVRCGDYEVQLTPDHPLY